MKDRDLWRISLGCYFSISLVDFEFSRHLKTSKYFLKFLYPCFEEIYFLKINFYIHVLRILYWATLMYPTSMKILAANDSNCMDMLSNDL
jgi:hypothetical protein